MMTSHPAYPRLKDESERTGKNAFEILGDRLEGLMKKRGAETMSSSLQKGSTMSLMRNSALDQRPALLP